MAFLGNFWYRAASGNSGQVFSIFYIIEKCTFSSVMNRYFFNPRYFCLIYANRPRVKSDFQF